VLETLEGRAAEERELGRALERRASVLLGAAIGLALIGIALFTLDDGDTDVWRIVPFVLVCLATAAAAFMAVRAGLLLADPRRFPGEPAVDPRLLASPARFVEALAQDAAVAVNVLAYANEAKRSMLRWGGTALAMALPALVALAVVVSGDDDEPPAVTAAPRSEFQPVEPDFALAKRFQPYLLFDSSEPWRPLDADFFFNEGVHTMCTGERCDPIFNATDFARLSVIHPEKPSHLRVNAQTKLDPKRYTALSLYCHANRSNALRDCDTASNSVIYYHVVRASGRILIDYWFFFRYNDAPFGTTFDHQSDWEGVTVAIDETDQSTFDWAAIASHEGVYRYFREDLSCGGPAAGRGTCGTDDARAGERLNVFVANGTHASYPFPCRHRLRFRQRLGLCVQSSRIPRVDRGHVPENGYDGRAAWARNNAADSLRPMAGAPWVDWGGTWDPTAHVKSPARQGRYRDPTSVAQADCPKDLCLATAPAGWPAECLQWFGTGTAATACNPRLLREELAEQGGSYWIERTSTLQPPAPGGAAPKPGPPGACPGRRAPAPALEEAPPVLEPDLGETEIATPLSQAASSQPGVSQLAGDPLLPGEGAVVEGAAPVGTELFVRAIAGGRVIEGRFRDLGLSRGGSALLRVFEPRKAGDAPFDLCSGDGARLRALQFRTVT
jgi:hypothetical protein